MTTNFAILCQLSTLDSFTFSVPLELCHESFVDDEKCNFAMQVNFWCVKIHFLHFKKISSQSLNLINFSFERIWKISNKFSRDSSERLAHGLAYAFDMWCLSIYCITKSNRLVRYFFDRLSGLILNAYHIEWRSAVHRVGQNRRQVHRGTM